MPGPAPKPPDQRRTRHKPRAGEWQAAPGIGWQHGKVPALPSGLSADSRRAWKAWFASWAASFWKPEDESALRTAITLYDEMMRKPSASHATALGQYLDRFGLTPKGRQDRRWLQPETMTQQQETPTTDDKYRRLRVVGG